MRSVALSPQAREAALDAMSSTELDVLVVGGGVVGSGAALDAATRGLSVGLVEARDFASGTSSRSSKLIHGGLRYLEMLDFRLVSEALQERGLLIQTLAPHLVRPGAVPLPAHPPRVGAALRRCGRGSLRHPRAAVGPLPRRAGAPPPHPARRPQDRAVVAQGGPHRGPALLRRPGRRRPAHHVRRPHRRGVRSARGVPGAGSRAAARGRTGHRGRGARPGVRPHASRSGPDR